MSLKRLLNVLVTLLIASIIMAGCAQAGSNNNGPVVKPLSESNSQQISQLPSKEQSQINGSDNETQKLNQSTGNQHQSPLPNRVELIYFHMTQRCVTCLCFEEHINTVIEKYFADAIANGKLTYSVLNAQESQNSAIAKKYQVVGSQLFINKIVSNVDNIEDIQSIWDWNCRTKPADFESKVKNAIEKKLKELG